jgi:hypothetical protein
MVRTLFVSLGFVLCLTSASTQAKDYPHPMGRDADRLIDAMNAAGIPSFSFSQFRETYAYDLSCDSDGYCSFLVPKEDTERKDVEASELVETLNSMGISSPIRLKTVKCSESQIGPGARSRGCYIE